MASAATMRSSFQSRVSTRKDSLFKMNHKKHTEDDSTKDDIEGGDTDAETGVGANADAEKATTTTTMTTKLSQMKLRMSENTTSMKNNFATKVSTTKESILKINKGGVEGGNDGEGEATADGDTDKKMPAKLSQMKLRMSGLLSIKKKKNDTTTNAAEGKEDETTTDLATTSTGDFTFTIDGEDDDDVNKTLGTSSPAGYVALSIDDAPCRFDDRSHSQLENVLDLLKRYDAKATFVVISSFLAECHEPDMIRLLEEGHELANHGVRDEAMDKMATSVDTFVEALDECNNKIIDLQKKANVEIGVKWFRAPQSRYTKIMEEGLVVKDMHNVMCDAYAACPIVEDGPWIASTLSKQIRNGSIACLHMPEKCGFREHCLEAMEQLLEDLKKRNFKVVTVGELQTIAESVAKPGEETELNEETIVLS
jgi:peptidoglycan/xylan/chitin deacetylase (PgdA/CDA1 family)